MKLQITGCIKSVRFATALAAIGFSFAMLSSAAQAQNLRVFLGGQQRPDIMRKLFDIYESRNPGVKIEIEVGGATSEQQQQYLNTVLTSRDATLDAFLIDIVRPAQYAAAGWAEPLDAHLGAEKDAILSRVLPAYREANIVNGRLIALPFFADAQFLYYRKDLLDKYRLQPPKTWEDLIRQAQTVQRGENNSNLQGFSTAGAPIEGTVCSYLVPLWGAGGNLTDAQGRLSLAGPAARRPFDLFAEMRQKNVTPANLAEIATDRIRLDFQSGNTVFAMLWAYGWNRFQSDADSHVKDRVGVVPLPSFAGGRPASCIGGWQWAVSAFSRNKPTTAKLIAFLASPEASKFMAINASNLPIYSELYTDPDVLRANPWFREAREVMVTARARPVAPNYTRLSEVIRTNMNAFIAGTKTADAALADMTTNLQPLLVR